MPVYLDDLLASRPQYDLDSFVAVANELLPSYLPDEPVDARVKGEVNARLVRHYTSAGLLEPPLREGREARYTVDHLLQVLALRRLIADGVTTTSIDASLRQKDRDELLAIIEGGARVDLAPAGEHRDSALAYLDQIRQRASGARPASAPSEDVQSGAPAHAPAHASTPSVRAKSGPSLSASPSTTSWERYQLLDGVELHVRSDVKVPTKAEAQRRLLEHITRLIVQIGQRRMK